MMRYIVGDVFDRMAQLPDGSVDLVLTSPPFLALRSYLPADHPDKAKEIGSEPTPGEFIDTLCALSEEWARVLTPHGSICVELGDTYSGSGGGGGDYLEGGMREGQAQFAGSAATMRESNAAHWRAKNTDKQAWPEAKSLCLIPELYRVALVYGFNPLTGRETPRWRARNVVRWCCPNPPVGALGDKFRPGTSDMVIACKARDRWFDLDAVRTPSDVAGKPFAGYSGDHVRPHTNWGNRRGGVFNPNGAPPLDWWQISSEPYKGSHYATWPTALLTRPILSMCPQRVCVTCEEPSRRIVDAARISPADDHGRDSGANGARLGMGLPPERGWEYERTTLGWSDCGHDRWRPGTVLDPFAGSGTTLLVADGHGRNAIGIDLDQRNADLARERIGMYLDIEQETPCP